MVVTTTTISFPTGDERPGLGLVHVLLADADVGELRAELGHPAHQPLALRPVPRLGLVAAPPGRLATEDEHRHRQVPGYDANP